MFQYILVKFLEPRQDSAGKISIIGIKFSGFVRKPVLIDDTIVVSNYIFIFFSYSLTCSLITLYNI